MIKRRRATPVSLLILTVILRTLIAPGYMLSTSAADGMRIVFCNGPVGLPGHHHLGDPQEGGPAEEGDGYRGGLQRAEKIGQK